MLVTGRGDHHSQLAVAAETIVTDTAATTTRYVRDPAGRLLAATTPLGSRFFLTDGLGSVVGVTDPAGQPVAAYRYDPFGQATHATGVEADLHRWRFAGAYLDATGLYKIGQRYYRSGWGRWTQPDPIYSPVDPKLWNPYVYVGNDPVNYIDPTGLRAQCLWDGFVGITSPKISAWLTGADTYGGAGVQPQGGWSVNWLTLGERAWDAGTIFVTSLPQFVKKISLVYTVISAAKTIRRCW